MNPIFVTIGGFDIRWYSVLILIAAFLVLQLSQMEAVKFKVKKEFMFNILFWALIFGIIGARLYYVIFNWEMFKDNPLEIIKIWNGGLAIHGGLLAGLLTIVIYCKKYNVRIIRILDFIVVPLLLAQGIGRWGNFFNQEAYGAATTVAKLETLLVPDFVIEGMNIGGVLYTPTFYFESVACIFFFIVLLIMRRGKYVKVGTMTGSYLIIYGVVRFIIEMSRTDSLMIGGFKVAQIVSVLMFIVGLLIIMFVSKKSKFEDLYNDVANSSEVRF